MRASSWTLSNRRSMTEGPPAAAASSIIAIAASQYLSIKYTERLAEAGIEPSVSSVGDSYDNALAETINGLYKAEVIHRRGPWRNFEAVEFATLEWVDWFNNRRLLEPHRLHPAGRRRGTLLRHAERHSHGRVTQTKWPPAKPERFTLNRDLSCSIQLHPSLKRVFRRPRRAPGKFSTRYTC